MLVIGITQSGKSTFINKMASMAINPERRAVEGKGMRSCTKNCGQWELEIPTTDYKLVTLQDKEIHLPKTEEDLLGEAGKYWSDNSKVVPTDPRSSTVKFRIIDTPGLDDGDGDDMENIVKVLEFLNQSIKEGKNPTINALMFIASCKSAFSKSFQKYFKYYESCMPDLFGGLVMVNTKFTIKEWKQRRRNMKDLHPMQSARPRIIRERRADFADLLERDPTHFYVDSKPEPPEDPDNLEVLLSHNAMAELLGVVAAQKQPLQVKHMKYVKSLTDIRVDETIQRKLQYKMSTWTEHRRVLLAKANADERLRNTNKKHALELEQAIKDLRAKVAEKDHSAQITLRREHTPETEDISLLKAMWNSMSLRGLTSSLEIREPEVAEFDVDFIDKQRAKWTSRNWKPETKAWVGTYKTDWGQFPVLFARSYARSSVLHAADISRWREDIRQHQLNLAAYEGNDASDVEAVPDSELDRLVLWISQCEDVIAKLAPATVPLETGFDEAARARYKKGPNLISDYDVINTVRTYYSELAAVLERV
jgi:hypothetical protein